MSPLERKLSWLTGIRMLVTLSIVLPYYLFRTGAGAQPTPYDQVLQALMAVVSVQTLLYIVLLRGPLKNRTPLQAYIQFAGDLLLVTLLIYKLGIVGISFSIFYFVVISVAAVLLHRTAAVATAFGAFFLYGFLIFAIEKGWHQLMPKGSFLLAPPPDPLPVSAIPFNLALHFLGFLAVALLTSYLSGNVARAQEELRQKMDHIADLKVLHRDIIQSISSGLATTDLEGIITSINQAGCQILGREEQQLLGRHISLSGLFSLDQWHRFTRRAERKTKGRSEVQLERGGETVFVGFSLTILMDGKGVQRGYNCIFQDFTENRKLQERVRTQDRLAAIGEMAAGLAHEIGNPLAAISGSVQMMAHNSHSETQRKLLAITLKESQRLDRTVKSYLNLASPKEKKIQNFDIAALLKEQTALLRNSEEVQDDHRIVTRVRPASAEILADPDQVSQIFWNLARNALRAMPDGGHLTVSGTLTDHLYRIEFQDTGRGMSPEEQARLFNPFHSFFDNGTGIGMAIVFRIIQEHDGEIHVDSELGKGSTFRVELPVHGGVRKGER